MSVAIVLSLGAALGALTPVFLEPSWWFAAVGTVALVTFAIVAVRALTRWAIWGPLAGILALVLSLTFGFAPDVALVAVIPTPDVLMRFLALSLEASESIASQGVPAEAVTGIVFLLAVGAGLLAIVLDGVAFVWKRPALIGVPLLGLLAVPTIFDSGLTDPFSFALTAGGYLLILYLAIGESRTGGAVGVGAIALAAALVVPLALPPVAPDTPDEPAGAGGFTIGINTFISLGDNLRKPNPSRVLTYRTTAPDGQYLTVSTISDFSGDQWKPTPPAEHPSAALDTIGPIPGLASGTETYESATSIELTGVGGRWAPAPYAPTSVDGLGDDWSWDPDTLNIISDGQSVRGAKYTVQSTVALPSEDQLRALDPSGDYLDRYLEVPPEVDDSVRDTAAAVVGDAANNFDKAMALQDYFTGGDFEYSERAPVMDDYDGTGASVVSQFLEEKSGYCVHFSSAMAIMARTLDIPARIAVGFTPGEIVIPDEEGEEPYFSVSSANLHAWPELYFDEVGWVRFEPTPGRGVLPDFTGSTSGEAPNAPPTLTPSAEPTAAPVPTTAPTTPADDPADAGTEVSTLIVAAATVGALALVAVVIVLIPLLPMLVRFVRRRRRYWHIWRRASAPDAWRELSDTAIDLGWKTDATTPREFEDLIHVGMPQKARDALERLRAAIEATAYSREPAPATVRDVRIVRRAMARASQRTERMRARFTPRSVVLRFRGRTIS